MRRVLPRTELATWLDAFLPQVPRDGSADWLVPGVVLDPSDGKLVHLDGVNLARAWNLQGIAAISSENYEGSHWLGSFATYLTTGRGITGAGAPR